MTTTALQISDLHRDPKAPLANGPLKESLLRALDGLGKLEPSVELPDLIVVAGDLVQGVPQDADPALLRDQYDQAEEFLCDLADELLDGSRHRVVIVPGNHDVSFPVFRNALRPVPYDADRWGELVPQLFDTGSRYRWSWAERELFVIEDDDAYHARLSDFAEFYNRFYQGERSFSLNPAEQFDIFDYPDLALSIVAYSSCDGNDPWRTPGDIHPEAIANSLTELRRTAEDDRFLAAVWHHSISAPPLRPDFMDEERVQFLLTHGFTLGLHGHQHRPENIHITSRFGTDGSMRVVSSGTLCAGQSALPPGRSRSFNLIELDADDLEGRLHVQIMINDDLSAPIWGRRPRRDDGSFPTFPITLVEIPADAQRRRVMEALSEATELMTAECYPDARDILLPYQDDGLARRVLIEALVALDDSEGIVSVFNPPRSDGERVHRLRALWDTRDLDELSAVLATPEVTDSTDPALKQVRDAMHEKLKL